MTEKNQKIIWRLVNVYPSGGLERKKLEGILNDCMLFLEKNEFTNYSKEELFPEYLIPCEIELSNNKTPLPGHIFLGINGEDKTYMEKVFEFFYRRKDIMHISNAPAIDNNIILNLKKMQYNIQNDPLNRFKVGDNVLVTKGEFSGMSGKILKKYKDSVDVSMLVFGRELVRNIAGDSFDIANN